MDTFEPHYITNVAQLEEFCESLKSDAFIAIDTEFIRERTYYPHLCLIQIAGEHAIGVIDPIATNIDLSPLYTVLNNSKIKKVFHSARQDLEIFYHLMGDLPRNIYDTQIAAMVCGFGESVGYETLVSHLVNKKLDKSLSISNWAHRPLTKKQIAYAVGDVVYLREIYLQLSGKIEQKNRRSWIEEELSELLVLENYQPNLERQLSRLKIRSSDPRILARAFEILKLRETIAESEDRPRPVILRDELIVDLAHQNPKGERELKKIRGLADRLQKYELGQRILKALASAEVLLEEDYPKITKKPSKSTTNPMILEALKLLLKYVAKENEVADRIIASQGEIERLITQKEKDTSHLLKGWRYELFGKHALKFLNGELHIACENNKVILTPVSNPDA
jgi:ribonuclease D